MSKVLQYTLINGIKCYSPEEASEYTDYPDSGFDLTERVEEESFWVWSRNRLLKKIVNRFKRAQGQTRLVEIGCGNGAFIREIVEDSDLAITGSEVYFKGLLYAKKKRPEVEFVQFDVTQGRLSEEFDIIAAFDVLEHIDDDMAAIANIHAMLSRGGHFIVTVPQHKILWSRLDEIVKHKRRYSRSELLAKLGQREFEVRLCSSFVFVLFPLMAMSRLLDRRKDDAQSSEGEFESRVRFPRALNWIFDKAMRIDEVLILCGVSLPFGGTLLVVARKR